MLDLQIGPQVYVGPIKVIVRVFYASVCKCSQKSFMRQKRNPEKCEAGNPTQRLDKSNNKFSGIYGILCQHHHHHHHPIHKGEPTPSPAILRERKNILCILLALKWPILEFGLQAQYFKTNILNPGLLFSPISSSSQSLRI